MSAIKIIDRKTLGPSKYKLENVTYEMQGNNGKPVQKQCEIYHRPSGAAILLVDPERKKLLLTKQLRLPTYFNGNHSGDLIEVCAGLTDEGETVEAGALREVKEELGYQLETVKKIGQIYLSPGADPEISHLFIGKYNLDMKVGNGGGMEDEAENITILELDYAEVLQQVKNGDFQDAKTLVLLQHFFMNESDYSMK
ncbi:MAG: NUDIX domain-containing protein [Sphingobacteriaceae bacterium]|nr:MAG: NUDIX domain-containing protein [Sphingobacteriaceae bacterium]